jgi:hypothetical protein
MDRLAYIETRLVTHLNEIGADPSVLDVATWRRLPDDPEDTRRLLGFTAPIKEADWYTPFCPQIIAESASGFDDKELEDYIDAIEYAMDFEVISHMLPASERIFAADNAMIEHGPGSMRLISEAQMHMLDRQAGSDASK